MKQFRNMLFLFASAFFLILSTHSVYAGGGRMSIESNGSATVGSGISVKVKISESGSGSGTVAVGEHAEFKVANPRPGDKCDTHSEGADAQGYVYGDCYSNQTGMMVIYAHSIDKGDNSGQSALYFTEPPTPTTAPPTPTRTPTSAQKVEITSAVTPSEEPTPTIKETITPTPTLQAATAGFSSNNILGILLVAILALGLSGFILWKKKMFIFKKNMQPNNEEFSKEAELVDQYTSDHKPE